MLPFIEFCRQADIPQEWFCVIVEMAGIRGFCALEQLAEYVLSHSPSNVYYFGAECIAVAPTTVHEWKSVISAMCGEGLAAIATADDVDRLTERYLAERTANAPPAAPTVGDVILTETGYSYWRQYLSTCERDESDTRLCIDHDGCYMYVASTEEALKNRCPFCETYEGRTGMDLKANCSRFSDAGESSVCRIKSIGPFWMDNYTVSLTGYALRCEVKVRTENDAVHGLEF